MTRAFLFLSLLAATVAAGAQGSFDTLQPGPSGQLTLTSGNYAGDGSGLTNIPLSSLMTSNSITVSNYLVANGLQSQIGPGYIVIATTNVVLINGLLHGTNLFEVGGTNGTTPFFNVHSNASVYLGGVNSFLHGSGNFTLIGSGGGLTMQDTTYANAFTFYNGNFYPQTDAQASIGTTSLRVLRVNTLGVATSKNNKAAPTSITVSASPFSFTNTQPVNIQVFLDANGATTALAYNGTTIFSSLVAGDHAAILQPGDWLTVTYSIATPIMTYREF